MTSARRAGLSVVATALLAFALACGHYGPPRRAAAAPAPASPPELEEPAGDPAPAESKPEREERSPAPTDPS